MNTPDPFALARSEADAELFALIAEYQRLEEAANERGIDDDERRRRCADADPVRGQIEAMRPATLRGVLAALDFGSDMGEDPDYWPEGAIEGLRAIVEREARS
jgi:hypothetical protein